MAELKTRKSSASVDAFLDGVKDERRRHDARRVLEIMQRITGEAPQMWGASIVGFGSYRYQNPKGKGGEWFRMGFSPRKQNLTLYLMDGVGRHEAALKALGKHRTGVGCLYINALADIDLAVLERLLKASVDNIGNKQP